MTFPYDAISLHGETGANGSLLLLSTSTRTILDVNFVRPAGSGVRQVLYCKGVEFWDSHDSASFDTQMVFPCYGDIVVTTASNAASGQHVFITYLPYNLATSTALPPNTVSYGDFLFVSGVIIFCLTIIAIARLKVI